MPLSKTRKVVSAAVLVLIVVASATQTEVANYLTAKRGFSKPYLTFYLTHSTFSIIFPLHLAVLKVLRPRSSSRTYVKSLLRLVSTQLAGEHAKWIDARKQFMWTILGLTALISIPSLCWFIAVPLTGVTDLTALYATATFFTYGFSLLLLRTPLSRMIVAAIVVAFLGVLLIALSGVEADKDSHTRAARDSDAPPHRIVGDLIMLVGAAVLGLYEVIYKLSLPEGQGGVVGPEKQGERTALPITAYHAIHPSADLQVDREAVTGSSPPPPLGHRRSSSLPVLASRVLSEVHGHPHLPIGLHANFLTSCIGLATAAVFWLPLPVLNFTALEDFEWPGSNVAYIAVICLAGATYNAGFMCLIGLLGPVTASVANLLAIGLVALVDAAYLGRRIPLWTLLGAGLVAMGFGVLLYEGEGEATGNLDEDEDEITPEDFADDIDGVDSDVEHRRDG